MYVEINVCGTGFYSQARIQVDLFKYSYMEGKHYVKVQILCCMPGSS
jgi:hypothetical protein